MRKLGGLVALVALVFGLQAPLAHGATAPNDELPPSQDNGADGRADNLNSPDIAPKIACNKPPATSGGSQIVRRLPRGPMRPDDSTRLAFTSGVCIYLPPGYSTSTRYPVLYLLHGGGGDQADWVNFGSLQKTGDLFASKGHPLIIVMPDGDNGVWYDSPRVDPTAPDAFVLNETYVIDYVIPFVDRHYSTIADRRGRIVSGLSNGGLGAFVFSAKHPDLFVAASSMSGNLGGYEHDYDQLDRPNYHDGNTPTPLAENLQGVPLIQFWGGQPCGTTDLGSNLCLAWAFEQSFRYDNQNFHATIESLGTGYSDQYEEREGSHSWIWWTQWLRDDHLPFLVARVAAAEAARGKTAVSAPPTSWHYKTISPRFRIWGYSFVVTKAPQDAWLSLTNVTAHSMTLTGVGHVTVTTPRGTTISVDLVDGTPKTIAT
ncbi:MAG: hypothetical protein QOD30_1165 [Actinomycetota bacterium]|nr:hypothetical protein [Actinomycetota bacterium]